MDHESLEKVTEGFRRVGLTFPYLAGLIDKMNVQISERVSTMGVFASGRLLINPKFLATLSPSDLMFVLTHELMHLTLRTHDRGQGSDAVAFNYAHDYIINDILCEELQVSAPPAGGLHWAGARKLSAEKVFEQVRQSHVPYDQNWMRRSWQMGGRRRPKDSSPPNDALDGDLEREWFGDLQETDQEARTEEIREEAARALGMQALMEHMKGRGDTPGSAEESVAALRGLYRPPWELALQRWLESVSPGDRTYARPSRRGADRVDVVLPGRKREGWMLHVLLDTSGSMVQDIPRALGAIADFCEAMGVERIRLVQCDTEVAADETLSPAELSRWTVRGYGGSNLTPAMTALALEPDVEAAVIITDGEIEYPQDGVPYKVLWVLPAWAAGDGRFAPSYGAIVPMN